MKCRLCGCENKFDSLRVKELEMGFRDEFEYCFCKVCGTLQIKSIPEDLSKYYPSGYYSFKSPRKNSNIKRKLKKFRDLYGLYGDKLNILGHLLSVLYPLDTQLLSLRPIIKTLNTNSQILDVGCGEGAFLSRLANLGFKNLKGVDPFIANDKILNNGVNLYKTSLIELNKTSIYNLIMFHHSFEHLTESPYKVLRKCNKLLTENGYLIIRMPTTSSFAWERYRENWVGIQAPRHIMIYSIRGFEILAKKTGFMINSISFDSTFFTLVASEQYKRNIALNDDNSYFVNPEKSIFTKKDIEHYKKITLDLNKKCRGDMICVILKKK
jgi:2-polyprenyl-3-methyl-5-hydroxy-6-metoxy-1,4-benzoquinol methylase